jgi:3-oxoadipate enol-lactonase
MKSGTDHVFSSDAFRQRHADVVSECVATLLRNDVHAYAASCRMLGAMDLRSALPRTSVPTGIRDVKLTVLKGA